MRRMLLIVLLALASNACASAPSPYHAVSEGVLIPPVSRFGPPSSEVMTPRPPAPEVVIDDLTVECPPELRCDPKLAVNTPSVAVSTPNLLQGKLNKQLAPHIKMSWSAGKQAVTAPVVVAKSLARTPKYSERELKEQINSLLAQIDSLQNHSSDRQVRTKVEPYASELAATRAELAAANALKDKALDEVILQKQADAITQAKLVKTHRLLAATRGGYMQWRAMNGRGRAGDPQGDFFLWVIVLLSLLTSVLAFSYARLRNKLKSNRNFQERITALEDALKGRDRYIRELKSNQARDRISSILVDSLRCDIEEKDGRIVALEGEIKEQRSMYRKRIQELKRQRAGPLQETRRDVAAEYALPADKTPPQEASGEFFRRVGRLPQDASWESSGPLDPGDEQEE